MVLLIVIMAISSIVTLTVDEHVVEEIHTSVNKQRVLADVELHYTRLILAENSYALTGDTKYTEAFEVEKRKLEDGLKILATMPLTVEEATELERFRTDLATMNQEMAKLFSTPFTQADKLIQQKVEKLDNSIALELSDEILALSLMIEDEIDASIHEIEEADKREFWFTIIPVVIVVPLAIFVVFFAINHISKPLLLLVQMAEKITLRDFSTRMKTGSLDEIGMLTRAFNAMAEEIERRYDELESFAYIVAHDLKNPIAGVYGLSEVLIDSTKERLNDEERDLLVTLQGTATSMDALVTDLLDFARAGKIEFAKEPVSMGKMLDSIREELKFYVKERNAKIIVQDDLPAIYCDPVRFTQVWKNLIYNAIKYCDKPEPTVEVTAEKTSDGMLLFEVKDNGIGIDEKDFDYIFLPFKRAETEQQFEGTGIGLAIVKRVIDFHGGKVWITSTKGKGTTFHFTLPLAHPKHTALSATGM